MDSSKRVAFIDEEAQRMSAAVLENASLRDAYRPYASALQEELLELARQNEDLRARSADALVELMFVVIEGAPLSLRLGRRRRALEASREPRGEC